MATTFTTAQRKGGAGKTTLIVSLAAILAAEGLKVIIVDTDPSEDASFWASREEHGLAGIDYLKETSEVELPKSFQELEPLYDVIMIDTAGYDSRIAAFAMIMADLVLIPTRPSTSDINGALATKRFLDKACAQARKPIPCLGVCISFKNNTNACYDAEQAIKSQSVLEYANAKLWDATSFVDIINTGERPKGHAQSYTKALLNELRNKRLLPTKKPK